MKTATYEEVDSAKYKWLKNARHDNSSTNSNMFNMKVLEFAKPLGFDDFQAFDGRLGRWKKRLNVSFKTVSGKYTFAASLGVVTLKCLWIFPQLKKKLAWDLHFFPVSLIDNLCQWFPASKCYCHRLVNNKEQSWPIFRCFSFGKYPTRQLFIVMAIANLSSVFLLNYCF